MDVSTLSHATVIKSKANPVVVVVKPKERLPSEKTERDIRAKVTNVKVYRSKRLRTVLLF